MNLNYFRFKTILNHMLKKLFTSKLFPFWFFHVPIFPYYLYASLRRRNLAFFTNINPNWHTGGFVNSSKIDAFKGIDSKWLPKSVHVSKNTSISVLKTTLSKQNIHFPYILKPNEGERGLGVIKLTNNEELEAVLNKNSTSFIIQEFIDFPLEFGILYYRCPITQEEGITSICNKEVPFVLGDGKSTLLQLVTKKYKNKTFENLTVAMHLHILEIGEPFLLEYIAHRNRNCVFKNFNHLYSEQLLSTFKAIASKMDSFYFGRFDIKVTSIEDLLKGKNIKILEVNGANSQPIHIFDTSYSFYKCYRDLHTHWRLIHKISKQNSTLGNQPDTTRSLAKELFKKYRR